MREGLYKTGSSKKATVKERLNERTHCRDNRRVQEWGIEFLEEESAILVKALNRMMNKSSTEDADFEILSETNPDTTMPK